MIATPTSGSRDAPTTSVSVDTIIVIMLDDLGQGFAEAKIGKFHMPITPDEDIVWLEVAVNNEVCV